MTASLESTQSPGEVRAGLELPYTHVEDIFAEGDWVPAYAAERAEVIDPATGDVWGSVPQAGQADLDRAVSSARSAFDNGPWRQMTAAQRADHLLAMADAIEARTELIAVTNTRENGTPITESRGAAGNAAGILRYFASLAPMLDEEEIRPFPHAADRESLLRRDPVGVCALIAPWNFPINLMVIKLAPALLAGCSVVMKPASPTPLSFRHIVDASVEAGIPAGVVNLVTGPGRMGEELVRHKQVDKVAFTGSTPVGRRIASAAGELLRPVTLELGGKSSAVVLEDADLGQMSQGLVRACMRNTGQTCYISTRILAPRSRYTEVVDMVTETIGSQQQGDPLDPSTVFGPAATASQYRTVLEYIESAHSQGARATTGGRPARLNHGLDKGFFIEPTVFVDVTPEMRVATEEIFGPVVTITAYDDVEEAVSMANSTEYGLGGIVYGQDTEAAVAVADRIDSGSVGINFFASNHSSPFGGRRNSGLGTEYGPEGLAAYLSYKSIHRRRGQRG